MPNDYYNKSGWPATSSTGTSAPARAELTNIAAGFDKLPAITGNGSKAVVVNAGATALTVTTGTLALAGNFATTGAFNTTVVQGANITVSLPVVSGLTLATVTGTETLTNKTVNLTSNTLVATSAQLAAALTDETGSGSVVFATSPTLTTPTLGVATATSVNKVTITAPATTATLTLVEGSTLATSGANSITLTSTGATDVTLPTTGTLVTLAGSETLTNKTLTNPVIAQVNDANGNETLKLTATASAVNEITLANAGTGNAPSISATGGDADISLNLVPKGSGVVQVNGADITPLGKNVIVNPDGAIYNRAAAATADDVYFANNWYILSQTNTVTPSVLSDPEDGYPKGVRITQSQAVAQRFGFAQIIEGKFCKHLRGQSGVMVPRIRCSSAQAIRYAILGWTGTEDTVTSDVVNDWTSATYTAGNFFNSTTLSVIAVGSQTPTANTWTSLAAITASLGSAFNNIVVLVWTEGTAAQNVTLDWDFVQLERGTAATQFERRPFALEEILCARYLPYFASNSINDPICPAWVLDSTNARAVLPLAVKTRTQVTGVTVSNGAHFGVIAGGGTGNGTAVTFNASSDTAVRLNVVVASGLAAGQAADFFFDDASGTLMLTGAEL